MHGNLRGQWLCRARIYGILVFAVDAGELAAEEYQHNAQACRASSSGAMTRNMFTGSMVGVIKAAAIEAPTMAMRHCSDQGAGADHAEQGYEKEDQAASEKRRPSRKSSDVTKADVAIGCPFRLEDLRLKLIEEAESRRHQYAPGEENAD